MENYVGKTLIDAMKNASKATGLSLETVRGIAHVIAEKKTLLSSQVIIGLFSERDVYAYACTYLDKVLALLRVRASYKLDYDSSNQVIKIIIETDRGSQVIGRNGENLKAINTLVRSAIFNRYGGDYRILLDCDGYKDIKYQKIISMAKRAAEDVLASHAGGRAHGHPPGALGLEGPRGLLDRRRQAPPHRDSLLPWERGPLRLRPGEAQGLDRSLRCTGGGLSPLPV